MTKPKSVIVSFHQDDCGDWIAELACGHSRHIRHTPPWLVSPWVLTEEGRRSFLGSELECSQCERTPAKPEGLETGQK